MKFPSALVLSPLLICIGCDDFAVDAKGFGGKPSPTPPRPSIPTRPSPTFPSGPTFPNPSPAYPSVPTFPSPSYPTYPSIPTFPSVPTFPSPSYPTYPTIPSYPSGPTRPSYPTHNNGNRQDCFDREVNVTDSTTNITETVTETICTPSSSSSGGASGGSIAGAVLATLVLVGAGILACVFCNRQQHQSSDSNNTIPTATAVIVEEPVSWTKIRQTVQEDAATAEHALVRPTNGTFEATYEDDEKTLTTSINLAFVKAKTNGWTVEGRGQDADGEFMVLEGLLSPTGLVYWIEECSSGMVLSEGRFCMDGTAMEGTWEASNSVSGSYRNFRLTAASETESSDEDDEPEILVETNGNKHDEAEIAVDLP